MKEDIIRELEDLLQNEDMAYVISEAKRLRKAYHEADEQETQLQLAQLSEEGVESADYAPAPDPFNPRFKELNNIIDKRIDQYELLQKEAEKNLLENKTLLITELKSLIADGARIGESFQRFKAIQEKWAELGELRSKSYRDLQSDYHHQVELFYYNINIKKDLRELDLKKNLEQKQQILDRLNQLTAEKSIKKLREQFIILENEWHSIGPVPRENKEAINMGFREGSQQIFQKTREHYEQKEQREKENLATKKELIAKINKLAETPVEKHKKWQQLTEEVLAMQKEWKAIGYSRQQEKIWQEFRNACDAFFEQKRVFYDHLKQDRDVHKEKKIAICERAEALQDNTQWKETTEKIIRLQQEWKAVGPTHQRDENKLWKRFRSACDHFFEAKKAFFASMDERQAENLKQKEALLQQIEVFQLSGDGKADLEQLKTFTLEWNKIGHIPKKEIKRIQDQYQKTIDEKYKSVDIDKKEKNIARFESKIEGYMQGDNADQLLKRERFQLKDKIRALEADIEQYEANLGFFGPSNKENPLKKVVEDKIDKAKGDLEHLKSKLKAIPTKVK